MKTLSTLDATKKRGSSFSHLSALIGATPTTNVGCGRIFRVDYLSRMGKWFVLAKLLMVISIPIFGGWGFTLYSVADNVIQKDATVEAQGTMLKAIRLGRLIYTIQKERDMSILYISRIGPGTKAFLIGEYEQTDKSFENMWLWPEEFAANPSPMFQTKASLIAYINQHRTLLDPDTSEVFAEISFYSNIVDFLMEWMVESIKDSGFGNTWKTLVVFQKITRCMLDTGAERAYGSMFFAQGNFPEERLYDNYFRRITRFNYNYRSATYYSDIVDPLLDSRTDQAEYTTSIRYLRRDIRYSNFSGIYKSLTKAEDYFDNVTFRMDYLFKLQEAVADRVIKSINASVHSFVVNIVVYSITASVAILAFPVIVTFSEALTNSMQAYSKVLVKASNELDRENSRTDHLLYQMLPKTVADRLKRSSKVESEFFKQSTVMFTSVVDFVRMSIEYSPIELLDLLNVLYTSIDEKISKYDVYKVETINDTYMVVSGVPMPNGSRHASELGYLALDVVGMMKHNKLVMPRMNYPIQLLVGINSGSVSAGVVGTAMPRYCLFGDTVNTASRMRSYGKPNRIHISDSTYRNLKNTGLFQMVSRGIVDIKGKGNMETFWLIDSINKSDRQTPTANGWRLPGEIDTANDSTSIDSNSGLPGGSRDIPELVENSRPVRRQSKATEWKSTTPMTFNMDASY